MEISRYLNPQPTFILLGPYDELIWVPGAFTVPQTGKKQRRITRIYVSAKESAYNGTNIFTQVQLRLRIRVKIVCYLTNRPQKLEYPQGRRPLQIHPEP